MICPMSLLQRGRLLGEPIRYGSPTYVAGQYPLSMAAVTDRQGPREPITEAVVFEPTWYGAELLLWGLGRGDARTVSWVHGTESRSYPPDLPFLQHAFLVLDKYPDIVMDGGTP